MSSPFDRYGPEKEQPLRKADVTLAPAQAALRYSLVKFLGGEYPAHVGCPSIYESALRCTANLAKACVSAADMREFSSFLPCYQHHHNFDNAGFFLSAVINGLDSPGEMEFVIDLTRLRGVIDYLGYTNKKNVTFLGNVGDSCGWNMEGGRIVVKGYAGESLGNSMKAGEILVERDAAYWCGRCMEGGRIVINGSAEARAGGAMRKGEIIIGGNAGEGCGDGIGEGCHLPVGGDAGKALGAGRFGGEIHVLGKIESLGWALGDVKVYQAGKLLTGDCGLRRENPSWVH